MRADSDIQVRGLKVAGLYSLIAGAWILVSDLWLEKFVAEPSRSTDLQTFKGLAFVITTAGFLYLMVFHHLRAVRRSNEAYRQLMEQASDAIFISDRQGNYVDVNHKATELTGYSRDELLRLNVNDLLSPEETERLPLRFEQLLAGNVLLAERSMLRKDGGQIVVEVSAGLVAGSRIQAIVRDITERQRADREVRLSEEKYRRIVETANEGIWILDADSVTTYVNRQMAEMLGYSIREMIGRPVFDFIFEEDREKCKRKLDERRRGLSARDEFRLRRKDGSEMVSLYSASPIVGEDGEVTGFLSMVTDITDRKRAEKALRESEERFRAQYKHLPIPTYSWRRVGGEFILIDYNDAANEVMAGELYRHNPEIVRDMARCFEERRTQHNELEHQFLSTGERRQVSVTYVFVAPDLVMMHVEDVTKRKFAEENIRRSEASLANAQRIAHIGNWEWDVRTNSLRWSAEVYKIFGVVKGEVNPDYELFMASVHPDDRERVQQMADDALAGVASYLVEHRIVRPDGTERTVQEIGEVSFDEQGLPLRMTGTVQDITERKLVEAQLVSSNAKLRALSTRIQSVREEESIRIAREIHDELGSALTGLKMDVALIDKRRSQLGPDELHQKLSAVSELIDETVRKVRNIATELRPSVLDDLGLTAAIEWQAKEFQRRTEIKCSITSLAEDLTLGQEKSTALFRIFQEILTNIARHARASAVDISLEKSARFIVLQVSDDGRGIKETDIANTKSLGLLGMRERALVFGGDVSFNGTEGSGTTITVRIPFNRDEARTEREAP